MAAGTGQNGPHGDIPHDSTRLTWRRLLDPAEPKHVMLADLAGEVVGYRKML